MPWFIPELVLLEEVFIASAYLIGPCSEDTFGRAGGEESAGGDMLKVSNADRERESMILAIGHRPVETAKYTLSIYTVRRQETT